MVDTHAHIALCDPPEGDVIAAAADAGVDRILTVGLGDDSNSGVVELAREHEAVFAAVGRHPNGADGFDDEAASRIAQLAELDEVVAVGETGLDFYRDSSRPADQRRAFAAQVEIAGDVGKPVVIHMRDADGSEDAVRECFETLEGSARSEVILHCFSATPAWAERAAANRWYCSFAGNSTYPKAERLRAAAALVPEDLLLVETDSPFLAPQPVRGKPNQPANVVATAERIAEVRGISYEDLERIVEANAADVFGW
ncbi:TatD family hydrolase [soil metagenome]